MELISARFASAKLRPAVGELPRVVGPESLGGTPVYNLAGDLLGAVERLMFDKITGRITMTLVSIGAALGIGDRRHVLPWSLLAYEPLMGGYVVNVDRKVLEGAPTFGGDESIDWNDEAWIRRLHDYYRVPHFWI